MPRLVVEDHQKLGEMIIKWARGEAELPKTPKEFLDAVNDNGAFAEVAGGQFETIEFTRQPPSNVLHVQLPHETSIDEMAGQDRSQGDYELPAFYDVAYDPAQRRQMQPEEKAAFRISRLGDYCIQKCH